MPKRKLPLKKWRLKSNSRNFLKQRLRSNSKNFALSQIKISLLIQMMTRMSRSSKRQPNRAIRGLLNRSNRRNHANLTMDRCLRKGKRGNQTNKSCMTSQMDLIPKRSLLSPNKLVQKKTRTVKFRINPQKRERNRKIPRNPNKSQKKRRRNKMLKNSLTWTRLRKRQSLSF